jgi:hypothetical protein
MSIFIYLIFFFINKHISLSLLWLKKNDNGDFTYPLNYHFFNYLSKFKKFVMCDANLSTLNILCQILMEETKMTKKK